MNLLKWQDIFVETESGKQLRFGNAAFTRTVDLSRGFPCTVSLCDASGNEFTAPDKVSPDCSFVGMDREQAVDEDYDVLFLDESLHVINKDMLDEELVLDFLKNKPEKLEIIMNGYHPSEKLQEAADYISLIQKEKHPFDQGIPARVGIEK